MNATHEPKGLSLPYGARRLSSPKGGFPVFQASSARPTIHRSSRINRALAKNGGAAVVRIITKTVRSVYFPLRSNPDWKLSRLLYSVVWNESSGARAEPRA